MKRKKKGPGGRPTNYNANVANEIYERMSNGETLLKICKDDHMPGYSTVMGWTRPPFDHESEQIKQRYLEFSDIYARARENLAERWAAEIVEIADDRSGDLSDIGKARVARDRLRVDTRKWLVAKVVPKIYGDRKEIEVKGETNTTIQVVFADESDESKD